jgi:glycosyltransferase involved in cell wall biosynthesis
MVKVSVLMAVYKTDTDYLKQSISSILEQTYKDFEFLILDDCPSDSREDVVATFHDPRIKYMKNEYNMGISKTRNKLIDMSQGEYLAVMDHDDISLPERLEKQVAFLDSHPKVGVVGTWYKKIPEGKVKKRYILNGQIERDLMWHCSILHPSSMIRKSVLDQNNLRYEEAFSPAEDYALWCRLLGKTHFANLPEILFLYRDYKGNTSKIQSEKMKSATQKIYEIIHQEHPEACVIEEKKLDGIPFTKQTVRGCLHKINIAGLFKFNKSENILMYDADEE